ncbi:MAG: zinc-dependent metalloprotease [Sphingomicrobium sp.]
MRSKLIVAALLAGAAAAGPALHAAPAKRVLLPVSAEPLAGRIVASFPAPGKDGVAARYLYVSQIESGLGSAPLALDFGQASAARLIAFRRVGKKVVAEIENPKFVSATGDENAQLGSARDFATSTIWTGDVASSLPGGGFSVDLAPFLVRDDLGIAQGLKAGGAGDYGLVADLSFADPGAVQAFPDNVEMGATLTFRAATPSAEVQNILPDQTLSLKIRHSLIALPGSGFEPRSDPFGYTLGSQQVDFSAPLRQPMVRNLIARFRLEKTDPAAERSRVVEPITFYIDPAAPEPVRQALRDGVEWWRQGFEAAGLIDAFRVEELPAGADPLDVRYNVVNWVNRATRGWSYGMAIADPRTGETVKGSVVLGSLRVRQDILIFQALVGANLTGTGDPNDPISAALARIRQLGAHEVGHALGFNHNFAASTQQRNSVMDYPPPRIDFDGGTISIANAYGVGLGAWDRFLVDYVYGARTDAEARAKVAAARAAGLQFVADADARPLGSGHPEGAMWDDGASPVAELGRVMDVRRAALDRFGFNSVPAGAPMAELRRSFVPIWLLHRYQVEAAAKSLGGIQFPFALAGEATSARPVPAAQQRAALSTLLATLSEDALTVPPHLLPILSAGSAEIEDRQSTIEQMQTSGRDIFDPMKATEIAAVQTLNSLLDPARLNRLEAQHSADPAVPSPHEVAETLVAASFTPRAGATSQRIATTVALALARAARQPSLSPAIAAQFDGQLARLAEYLTRNRERTAWGDWARGLGALLQDREALDKAIADPARLPQIPPGMPI